MNLETIQPYVLPLIFILFFSYRIFKFKNIKNKIPVLLSNGAVIVDVRSMAEFSSAHNPNSLNIPLDELNSKCQNLDKNKMIILCCASGTRSAMALGLLKKNGFKEVVNAGSWTNTLF